MTHTTPGASAASSSLSRRRFFSVTAVAGAATVVTARSAGAAAAASAGPSVTTSGADLAGWETVLGDALYAGPNQSPVSTNDIQTVNSGSFSTLRANIQRRGVMAHNIAFKRVIDNGLFDNVHVLSYQFRMPYLPTTSAWPDNAQTVEGGFFIWDGAGTRLDYGLAFQWVLNPWQSDFGAINTWTGSKWQATGRLAPDTLWHTVQMTMDRRNSTATLAIDGTPVPTKLTTTPKSGWGTETAARLQTEIVSLWPGNNTSVPSHRAEMRNWSWTRNTYA